MTKEQFYKEMKIISEMKDVEKRHELADELLIEVLITLGYDKGCELFQKMDKWHA